MRYVKVIYTSHPAYKFGARDLGFSQAQSASPEGRLIFLFTLNVMLGYDRVKAVLAETAGLRPQEIINRFIAVGEAWAEGHSQDDDVTFVVIRVGRRDDQL
jgi:hypothetical protein